MRGLIAPADVLQRGFIAALLLALVGCNTLPTEAELLSDARQQSSGQVVVSGADLKSEADPQASIGAKEHPRILKSHGGAYSDPELERLLAVVAGKLIAASDAPGRRFRITILNTPKINAFALPGGYIYVTRGLMALANDAAEVAAVLSHEMAHVEANHGVERANRVSDIKLSAQVVSDVISNNNAGKLALAASELKLAQFSRDQELQADALGIRLLGKAGYDPYAAGRFLDKMRKYNIYRTSISGADEEGFFATHPSTPRRIALAKRHARFFGGPGVGKRDRDRFLKGIDGLLYGDTAEEGFVRGRRYSHTGLGITFLVPQGFQLENRNKAVLASGPGESALRFDAVTLATSKDLNAYLKSGWVNGLLQQSVKAIKVNGFDGSNGKASTGEWNFDISLVRVGTQVYRFILAAPRGSQLLYQNAANIRTSFRLLSKTDKTKLKPLRIRVQTVKNRQSIGTLAKSMQVSQKRLELFRILNGLPNGASLKPGTKVKLVRE